MSALRDWVQWCQEQKCTSISDAQRQEVAAALRHQMSSVPDSTDWPLFAAGLALELTIGREERRLLQAVTDRGSFWNAIIRAVLSVDSQEDLNILQHALDPATTSMSTSLPSWVPGFLADVPGAAKPSPDPTLKAFEHSPKASHPAPQPPNPPVNALFTPVLIRSFSRSGIPAASGLLFALFGHVQAAKHFGEHFWPLLRRTSHLSL